MKNNLPPTEDLNFAQALLEAALHGLAIPTLENFSAIIAETVDYTARVPIDDSPGLSCVVFVSPPGMLPPETPANMPPWVFDRIAATFNSSRPGCDGAALVRRLQSAIGLMPLGVLAVTHGVARGGIPADFLYASLLEHRSKHAESYPPPPCGFHPEDGKSPRIISTFGLPGSPEFVIRTTSSRNGTLIATAEEYGRFGDAGNN